MKITAKLRSEIYQSAKKCVSGANPLFECGIRGTPDGKLTRNMLLVADDADLFDLDRLCYLKEIEIDDRGEVELDLYATTGIGSAAYGTRELECNVYVRFNWQGVIWATSSEARREELHRATEAERERALAIYQQ